METLKIKNKFKAIVVGCGKIGFGNKKYLVESHVYNYHENKQISLVCGVDIDKKN